MPRVAFHTLGCKVNFYDTEAIWHKFQAAGYQQVAFDDQADVYVINTCTVTNTGDKKSRQMVRRAVRTNPTAVIAVTGCYAQMAPDDIAAIAGVDLIVGNDRKTRIVDLVEGIQKEQNPFPESAVADALPTTTSEAAQGQLATSEAAQGLATSEAPTGPLATRGAAQGPSRSVVNILKTRDFEEMDVPYFEDRTRANLKIQDGCNNFCTFCIIPYARGLIRSRHPDKVVAQARKLAKAGYREIILTGIHTGGYGADLDGYRLAHLLRDLEAIDELHRVRISSIEASEIDEELIGVLGASSKICRHLHIPLQAGHDEVLRRMNRHYRTAEFAHKVEQLRQALPGLAVTSDVIVGFPGETDEHFQATEELLQRLRFSELHVFPYSPRKGTPAAKFTNQVPAAVKDARTQRLLDLSNQLVLSYATQSLGDVVEVIPEEPYHLTDTAKFTNQPTAPGEGPFGRHGFWLMGHTDTYLKVAFPVPQGIAPEHLMGEVCQVRLSDCTSTFQFGELVSRLTGEGESA